MRGGGPGRCDTEAGGGAVDATGGAAAGAISNSMDSTDMDTGEDDEDSEIEVVVSLGHDSGNATGRVMQRDVQEVDSLEKFKAQPRLAPFTYHGEKTEAVEIIRQFIAKEYSDRYATLARLQQQFKLELKPSTKTATGKMYRRK
jgi:hypothetical protein